MPLKWIRRSPAKRWIGYTASAALVAWLLLWILPRIGDIGEAGPLLLERLEAVHVAGVLGLLAVYTVSHALTLTIAAQPLSLRAAVLVRMVTGGVSRVVPGGWTAGVGGIAAMLRVHGLPMERVGHAIAVTGVWNTLTKLSLPLLGLTAEATVGTVAAGRAWSIGALSVVGALLTVAVVWLLGRERFGRWLGRTAEGAVGAVARKVDRDPPRRLAERLVGFQRSTGEALRERPAAMVAAYYPYHLAQAAMIWAGMHIAAGPQGLVVGWPEILTAFSLGYLMTALPVSPAGLGTLDVTVVGILVALGETPAVASAGIVLYRVATYGLYVPALAAWPLWHRRFRDAGPG